jgi:hypothetical protein
MRDGIVVRNRPEVYAVTGDAASVRHRLVQMGPGEHDEPGRRTNYFDRARVDLFLGLRLLPGIRLDMLGSFDPDSFYSTWRNYIFQNYSG